MWDNKVNEYIAKQLAQLDADCMVQLAAQVNKRIECATKVEDILMPPLSCYGVGLNICELGIVVTKYDVSFNETSRSTLIGIAHLTPSAIDHLIKYFMVI